MASTRRSTLRRLAVIAAAAAAAPMITGMMPLPARAGPAAAVPAARVPAAQRQHLVPVHAVPSRRLRIPAVPEWRRPPVTWPAAGSGTVTVTPLAAVPAGRAPGNATMAAASAGSLKAGSLPVYLGPADRQPQRGTHQRLLVTMAPRRAAAAAGVSGVILTLAPADATAGPGRAHVSLDYASFAYADGGDYASRLRLVTLPACALTTPQLAACRRQTPLASANNVSGFRLGADVTIPAAQPSSTPAAGAGGAAAFSPGPGLVLAATTSASGSGGSYAATPLAPSATWAGGGSSGAFTYSYPISVPPAPGGLAPHIALGYSSQAVDGLTSSTNNQASWIGDGWNYSPGYIERDYETCAADKLSPPVPSADKTGDLCWSASNTTTLSLNGITTTLVDDPSTGWHAQADTGQAISYKTGTINGTHDGGYWVITSRDGTSYYFGMSHLPGYASGDPATNSALTVPVYCPRTGDPCYNSAFSKATWNMAWRWQLDYVTDPHGDAMAYYYKTPETNYYAAGNLTNAAQSNTKATAAYTQASALSKIQYGLRAGAVYGVTPAAEVDFTTATDRTDIPTGSTQDLACTSGSTCTVISPSFWGTYRLTTIATQAIAAGGSLAAVDSWALDNNHYPSTGDTTPPSLWLQSISRTGQDGTPVSPALPPVTFSGQPMPNRVNLSTGYLPLTRYRMIQILTETGEKISANYSAGSCPSPRPADDANTTLCYPAWWSPPNSVSFEDWFNKYVVTKVSQNDSTGQPPVITSYCYGSSPGCLGSGAWHYDDDTLVRSDQRTWDQWRGFGTVSTSTGSAPDPVTQAQDIYFQGMDGDYKSGGGTTSESLTSTQGSITVTDKPQYAGMSFQHITDNGSGGPVVTDTITTPWTSAATATQAQTSPLPALQAYMTGTAETRTYTALAAGGYRESVATVTHDSLGRVTAVSDVPDTGDPSQDTCTTTSYPASGLLGLPTEAQVVSVPCTQTPALPADAVSDTRTFYDGATTLAGDTPSKGDVTMTQLATSYTGSAPSYTTQSKASYDQYGRVTSATDADGNTTTTAYTPAAGAGPTSVTVTDPLGLATITSYDPLRGLPLKVTSPAGWITSQTYDALGRITAVWLPTASQAGGQNASYTYSYAVSATGPSVITTSTLEPAGTAYLPSQALYDSLGRAVETQAQTPDGNRDITDTFYNSDGWTKVISHPYPAAGAPSGKLEPATDRNVPYQSGYVYDGAGRVIQDITYNQSAYQFETDTAYGGNYTTITPPHGGTATTTYTDGRGLTSYIYQYHSATPPASPPAPGSGSAAGTSGWDQAAYTYTPARQLATITDAAGNGWAYGYDLAGDQTTATAPDTGTTTSTYDPAGQLLSVTDTAGRQASYGYDKDGRKTVQYDTTGSAPENAATERAAWTYDTLARGQLTSAVAYPAGTTGASYTQQLLGYTTTGLPKGTQTIVSAGPLAGTYTTEDYYSAGGQLAQYIDSGAGGLPAQRVNIGYDAAGQPVDITDPAGVSYVSALSYTELGQPLEYQFGSSSAPAYFSNSYNYLGQLTEAKTLTGVSPVTVDDTSYLHDNYGNITAAADSITGDSQCYHYDYLGRLADAWAQGTPVCAGTPAQSVIGGPSPYWQHLGYDTASNITTDNWTYNSAGTNTNTFANSYGPAQPHTMTTQNVVSSYYGYWTSHDSYDAAGNLTSLQNGGNLQQLTWNDQDKLSQVIDNNGDSSSYTYDASGNLLLQTDNKTVTLYLPDEQITADTSTTPATLTGTRYYTIGGVTAAALTSSGDVQYLTGDQHGTSSSAIDYATLAVTRRYYTPPGWLRWPYPGSWPGSKGFAGGTTDTVTSLTNLGAREYNPGTGTFTSPDPVLTPYDPANLNPYAYAANNPVTNSDPTGLTKEAPPPCGTTGQPACNPNPPPPGTGGNGGGDDGGNGSGSGGSGLRGGRTQPGPPAYANLSGLSGLSSQGFLSDTVPCGDGQTCYASPYGQDTWAGWTKDINLASGSATALFLLTWDIPVVGEIAGAATVVTDALSAATNAINAARSLKNGDYGAFGWEAGGAVLSAVGAGAGVSALRALSAVQAGEEAGSAATDTMESLLRARNTANARAFAQRLANGDLGSSLDEQMSTVLEAQQLARAREWMAAQVGFCYELAVHGPGCG